MRRHDMVVAALGLMLALASGVDSNEDCQDGFFYCLKWDVAKALSRISTTSKDKIVLLNGIHLDKYSNKTLKDRDEINLLNTPFSNVPQLIKKAENIFDTHYLLVELVPGFDVKIYKTPAGKFSLSLVRGTREHNIAGARTFGIGARKRLQMALLPIMYKLGVITTLLVGLTVLTLKALTIGVILLILAFGGIFTKIKAVPWEEGYGHHKDVHIHVHPFVGKHHGYWKTWQRQEELDQIDPTELGQQQQQQQQHHSQKPLYDHHLHSNSLAGPPRPYSYFPPSVSGLID